jgi:hypothetical protein
MGDAFKKVQTGQRLTIPAEAYNAFIDTALAARGRQQFGADASPFFRQSGIAKVKNLTGAHRERFAIVGLGNPLILPSENEEEFKRQIAFDGLPPSQSGRLAILLEPIPAGKIGLAVVAGVVPVRLLVNPAQLYDFADIMTGNTHALRNVPAGSARVLWVDGSGSTERWAIVRLEGADYQAHVFILSNVPDAAGFFPGVVQRYDVATASWQTLYPCKVLDINQ